MLDTASDRLAPSPPSDERFRDSDGPGSSSRAHAAVGVEHLRSLIRRWRCDLCPYTTDDYADGRCPCERNFDGVEIACTGILAPVALHCWKCGEVEALAVAGDLTGPLCVDCADDVEPVTVRLASIPSSMQIADEYGEFWREQALVGGGR